MCEVTGRSQETVPEVAFKYAEALCGGWPQELVTPRGLRIPSGTLSDRPSACLAPCLGQEQRADKLPCACSCPSVGAELSLCTRLNSLLEMADDHEILLRAGKSSQGARPCLPGHAHPSSLALWDCLPVPLRVPSRLGQADAALTGEACKARVLDAPPVAPPVLEPRVRAPPSCLLPALCCFLGPWYLLSSVPTQPTLKGPTWPSIRPFVRTELAFPKFPQHICGSLSLFQTELICGCSHAQGPHTKCSRQAC